MWIQKNNSFKGSISYDVLNDKLKLRGSLPTGIPNTGIASGINIEDGKVEGAGKLDLNGSVTLPNGLKINGGVEQTVDNETVVKAGVGTGLGEYINASVEAKGNLNKVTDYFNGDDVPVVDTVTGAAPVSEMEN